MIPRHFTLVTVTVFALLATRVDAAEWKACERAKLQLLRQEQIQRSGGAHGRRHHRRATTPARNAAELDEWLWKNCREYSYELRALEQSRM